MDESIKNRLHDILKDNSITFSHSSLPDSLNIPADLYGVSFLFDNDFKGLKDLKDLKKKLPNTRKSTPETAIKHIREAYRQERLNFVLGAGISINYGIPAWDALLQRLLMKTIEQKPDNAVILSQLFSKIFNPSPLIAGRYLQECYKDEEKSKNKFEKEVRKALYETFNKDAESLIVDEIIKFCLAPGNSPNLGGIITYNYDDIIETKLREKNLDIPFESVYGQAINPENDILKIYHVHGFLPCEGNIDTDNKITLGEFVYHEQYINMYSWNNIVQINKFRDCICLFIGISLQDPNIRRLLDIANSQKKSRKYHYIFRKRTDKKWLKKAISKTVSENPELQKEQERIEVKLEETIDFLIELKNRFDEKDSESLGVKTVWVDNFDQDISEILKRIRQGEE